MWIFEGIWVICVKTPFLHSLVVPIKMFTNSLAILKQRTMRRTNYVHCFETQLNESCVVLWLWVDKRPFCCFFLNKNNMDTQTRIWVDGEWNRLFKFTSYSEIFLSLHIVDRRRGTHAQATTWGAQNVRCTMVYANILLDAQKIVYQDF